MTSKYKKSQDNKNKKTVIKSTANPSKTGTKEANKPKSKNIAVKKTKTAVIINLDAETDQSKITDISTIKKIVARISKIKDKNSLVEIYKIIKTDTMIDLTSNLTTNKNGIFICVNDMSVATATKLNEFLTHVEAKLEAKKKRKQIFNLDSL